MEKYNLGSCADVTVYSICNSDNSEIGTYNSIGQDSNGYSTYQSAANPTYQVYYDITTSVNKCTISCHVVITLITID